MAKNLFVRALRLLYTTLLAAALIAPLGAQQSQQPPPPVFRTGAQLTVETVTVKDKAGRPIEGPWPGRGLNRTAGIPAYGSDPVGEAGNLYKQPDGSVLFLYGGANEGIPSRDAGNASVGMAL